MNIFQFLFKSSLGRKYIMAVTGAALVVFVIGHMVGNLSFLLGREEINAYGHFLHTKPELLWATRIGLLVMIVLHIWSAIALSAANKAARPVGYAVQKSNGSSYASRTMLMSGLIVFCFIVYHLLHFTVQAPAVNLTGKDFGTLIDSEGRRDIYSMIVLGFSRPAIAIFYMVGVGLLSLHLSHGVSSLFQSLGLRSKGYAPLINCAATVLAVVLIIGYWSIPLSVLTGLKK